MASPGRRTVLGALFALAAAGCASNVPEQPRYAAAPAPRAGTPAQRDGTSGATILQIVAHPDDDLYFMSPDLPQSVDANDRIVSVYLTSGEANGRNKVPGSDAKPEEDFAGYAGSRQQGLRQAYALMATGDGLARWNRTTLDLPGGLRAEADSLADHPGVTLVFLGLSQHTRDRTKRADVGLPVLWKNPEAVGRTRVATGSTVREERTVTRGTVIDALTALLDRFRPTLVRTLDPDPDMQVHDAEHRRHHDQTGYSDHPDHTAAALFTYAALERYRGPGAGRHYVVTAYRGYYTERWPFNLPADVVRAKAEVLNVYGGSPGFGCGFAAGCGDYDVGRDRSYTTGWLQSTTYRYPGTTTWLRRGPDDRLTAFGVLDQQAAMWTETAPGSGRWSGPRLLGGGPLVPHIAVSLTEDGRWQLFAERLSGLTAAPRGNRREIVALEQKSRGGAFGSWVSLGNPEADPVRGRRVGAPVVARNADGSAQVFVRNWAKGVSTARQTADGSWSAWTDLGGAEVQEGLSAVTGADGRVHVVGAGHRTVHHWAQDRPNGPLTRASATGLPTPVDPPVLVARPGGALLLMYRQQKAVEPVAYRLEGPDSTWKPLALPLAGRGHGPMAAAADPAHRERAVLVSRDNTGAVSVSPLGPGATVRWSTLDGRIAGPPAIAADARGRLVVAALTPEGTLHSAVAPLPGPRPR
ncbi:hypothetical protein SSP35_20_00410 [Streptomyces sp. NBRC 110611]|uniref:PIG-L family deacetylase n=1 Tax=Streptomyces sp. NBRC 110611 TaxID=1621259 RepID=UPI00082F6F6E|nr:PIG-L family deacetylase [Streptomyces sp. NBRC 110611]GAU70545.1 hypothetical protein SSP35_20_00410 [Streptomyces sp. NBRC 110611]